jgi:hypothetical protein
MWSNSIITGLERTFARFSSFVRSAQHRRVLVSGGLDRCGYGYRRKAINWDCCGELRRRRTDHLDVERLADVERDLGRIEISKPAA